MNLDMERLLDAVRQVESGGNDYAVSPKGAKGPYQFMGPTAEQYGVADPFNEPQARDGARRYLSDLIKQFDGNIELAIVAYNGGPGRLERRGRNIAAMPRESQDYLSKVIAQYASGISKNNTQNSNFVTPHAQPASALEGLFPSREMSYRQSHKNLFPMNRENDVLAASVLQPKPVNEAQRIYEMQLRTGLPVGLIERNLEEIESKAKREDFDAEAFRKESPLLSEWMVKNPVAASLAHGDYENLSFLEKAMATFKAVPAGVEQGMLLERSMMLHYKAVEGTLTASEEMELNKLDLQLQELQRQNSQGLPSWFKEAGSIVGIQIPMALQAAKTGVQLGLPAGAAAGAVTGLIGGPGAPVTVTAAAAAGGVLGFKSFATASYIEQSYKMSVGEAYSDLKNAKDQFGNPIDPVAAKYAALLVGVPNAAMEFASLRMAVKVIPGADKLIGKLSTEAMKKILVRPTVVAALKDFGAKYAAAVGTETFTEGMQKLLVILSREIATGDVGEGLGVEDIEGIAEESAAAFKGSVVLGALASGPKVIGIYADIDKAAKNEQFMHDLGGVANNSSTYANSPKAFADYIALLKENGPVKNVFIPVDTWNALFQTQAPDAAAEVFGSLEQYTEAQTTGGDLVIPLETYAEKLAGTQYHAALVPNIRLNPGEMTPTEAAEAQQLAPEIEAGLQQEMAELIEKEAPLQQVYQDVFEKLARAGISPQEANRDATIVRERVRARAERLGVDPATLYAEEPLILQVEDPVIPEKLVTYNQQLVEPAVPNAPRLPLEGGEINLPEATEQETVAAAETIKNAQASFEEFGAFGATTHPVKGNLAGTEGVAVAGYPQRGVITEGAPTQADLEIFMRKNRDIFEADPNAALGVWVDQESGKGYIDIANVLPRDLAIEQGEYLGELAVWDLQAFEEIRLPIQRETGQGVLFQSAVPGSPEVANAMDLGGTLEQQPENVRAAIEHFIEKEGLPPGDYKNWDGDTWLFAIENSYPGTGRQKQHAAREYLKARGVKHMVKTENGEQQIAKLGEKFDPVKGRRMFQSAFHGSPYKFDKFSLEHLGSGEGAQAFGWGLYFAGKREISEWYRENLTPRVQSIDKRMQINGVSLIDWFTNNTDADTVTKEESDAYEFMFNALKYRANTQYNVKDNLQSEFKNAAFFFGGPNDPRTLKVEQLIREIEEADITFLPQDQGQLYEVNIPDDDVLLLYDETYENQPPKVQKAIDDILTVPDFNLLYNEAQFDHFKEKWTGAQWYDAVKEMLDMQAMGDVRVGDDGQISFEPQQPDRAASLYLNDLGVKGLKYRDATSRGRGSDKTYNYVIFDDSAIEILQTYYQEKRGFSIPTQHLIALLKDKDASTFLHESGHVWLEELRRDALRDDAPDQLKNDWETIKAWSGATDDEISVDAHEMFARGIERYVMEGNSPSFALREIFAQFKDWLSRIYKSFEMLDVELTPEVREVMDRLVATDEIIKETRERGEYHIPLLDRNMMTEAEYNIYRDLNTEAKREAEDSFRAKVMKELKREKLQAWRDEKRALAPTVRAEILEIPVYKAAYWLWSGKLPDGSTIPDMESHKLDKQALLDLGVAPTDLPFRYQENGLHPDVVADMFGFASGESMVRELVGLPSLQKAIDDEVNRQIREKRGGIIVEGTTAQEAAMEVQNTRQIEVFNMELRLLKRYGARREATHPAYMKELARKMVARKTLRELDPRIFEEAALKASQEAQDALLGQEFRAGTGRNLEKAFDAKQRQMLNVFLAKEAWEKRSEADKAVKKWKKFLSRSDDRLAKSYNMDMVNAARAIASVHGVGGAAETAAAYMANLAKYDPTAYEDMKDIVEMAAGDGRKIDDLTVAEFAVVKDAIEGLWTLARRTRQVEIDGVKMERETVVGELNTRIGELVIPERKRAGYNRAMTNWEKTKMALLGARAMLRRVEHWVDAMDNGKPDGLFRKYIWQPISEAGDQYRDHRRVMLEKYLEIAKQFPKESAKVGKIDAAEIGYEFKDKAELLGALLHTGNESNLQKLLRGRDWGAFDQNGELDSSRWDAFIARMQSQGVLTKADYDFVQSIWELFDEIKPQSQQAHKEMYGYYFEEITHKQFKTPFGDYKGGYYPATVDPMIVEDVAMRGEKEAIDAQPSSYMFPTTGRGFTKQRQEQYAKPLLLDLGLIPQQLEKVLRFIHLEPRIKDIGRVVIDKNFREHLSQLDSEAGAVMLVPWLQRTATQKVEQPSGPRLRAFDQFFHAVRVRSGLQIMAANVSVALQQFTGIALSAIKVKPRYLAGALWHLVSSPKTFTENVQASSTFMRNRTATQVMDIQKGIDNIMLNPSKYQKAKDFFNQHAYFMQAGTQNIVDLVTWGGAYEQATADGRTEKEAVRIADSAVRETQGTFAPEDISRFEAGPAHLRVFTMFYSYFNMAANLNATEFTKLMRQSGFGPVGGRALYLYTLGFMIPAVVSDAIVQAMRGDLFDDDDDDGYLDNLLSVFFGGQARMATAMVPVIGPVAQVGINAFNDKWYDDRINTSPAVSALEATARVPYDVFRLATEEDARLKRPTKDFLTLIGMATGMPVGPLGRPLGYLTDVEQGEIESPDNPAEFARGLISGVAPK